MVDDICGNNPSPRTLGVGSNTGMFELALFVVESAGYAVTFVRHGKNRFTIRVHGFAQLFYQMGSLSFVVCRTFVIQDR